MNAQNLTPEERRGLTALLRCLAAIADVNPSMPVGQALALVEVALNPGNGPVGYAKDLNQPESTVARWLLDLGEKERGNLEVKLLTWTPNPQNLKKKQYWLNPKGTALVNRFLAAWRSPDEHHR
jgi:DNA-binding MarR family transcriptional regulator